MHRTVLWTGTLIIANCLLMKYGRKNKTTKIQFYTFRNFLFHSFVENNLHKWQEVKIMGFFSCFVSRWGNGIKSSTDFGDIKDSTVVNSIEVGNQPDNIRTIFRHWTDKWYILSHPPGEGLPGVDMSFKTMFKKRNKIL